MHRARTADGVEIALHRLPGNDGAPALLLVGGTFVSHRFWTGGRGAGVAHALRDEGFDPWILEPRGHGASDSPPTWTLLDWVAHDAPAAVELVRREIGGRPLFWIGHSAGGVMGAAFAGSRHDQVAQLGGMVLLGVPGPALRGIRRAGAAATRFLSQWAPRALVPGRLLRLGPDYESASFIHHWMGWNLNGRWADAHGNDYLNQLSGLDLPILAIGGANDSALAPPPTIRDLFERFGPGPDRKMIIAGIEHGYSADYGHSSLVLGERARGEIWPVIADWLRERLGPRASSALGGETR